MWIHRKMLRVSWTDMLTNEEVLHGTRTERQLLTTIKRQKIAYLDFVLLEEKYCRLKDVPKLTQNLNLPPFVRESAANPEAKVSKITKV